jgi:hypothetical protein
MLEAARLHDSVTRSDLQTRGWPELDVPADTNLPAAEAAVTAARGRRAA